MLMTTAEVDSAEIASSGAFRFRLGTRADLPSCADLLPAGFRKSSPERQQLIALWERLLASHATRFAIFEDLGRPSPAGIEGFGLSVFVSDQFFAEFCASPQPYVTRLIYERMLTGSEAILTDNEVCRANSTIGLNALALHHGLRNEDLSHPRTEQVLMVSGAAFFFLHAGYRINTLITECYGMQQVRYIERGGFRLVRDFQRESPTAYAGMPPEHYPYLFMGSRDWVEPSANPMSNLFSRPRPALASRWPNNACWNAHC
jgi:hypothetical protein